METQVGYVLATQVYEEPGNDALSLDIVHILFEQPYLLEPGNKYAIRLSIPNVPSIYQCEEVKKECGYATGLLVFDLAPQFGFGFAPQVVASGIPAIIVALPSSKDEAAGSAPTQTSALPQQTLTSLLPTNLFGLMQWCAHLLFSAVPVADLSPLPAEAIRAMHTFRNVVLLVTNSFQQLFQRNLDGTLTAVPRKSLAQVELEALYQYRQFILSVLDRLSVYTVSELVQLQEIVANSVYKCFDPLFPSLSSQGEFSLLGTICSE